MFQLLKSLITRFLFTGSILLLVFASARGQQPLINYSAGLPATDALGRKLPAHGEVGAVREDKFVGLFYWTWHMNFVRHPPHNTTEILTRNPEAAGDFNHPAWPKPQRDSYFFWGEPLFGYYRNTDAWVLRKHAEMLADAGVDVIFFDCTNGHLTWKESYVALCKAFTEARAAGVKTPQIAFLLAFGGTEGSYQALHELYRELYQPGLYQDLWFYWKGKPLIMAYPETLVDKPGDAATSQLNRQIREFFTFRPGQPLYNQGPQRPDHWGWLEIFPQHGFGKTAGAGFEQATVGVAQNWSQDRGLTAMNAPGAFGRSYTRQQGLITVPGAVNQGFNFQEQWDRALELNPEFVFITGWNEWVANRFKTWGGQDNAFPDQYSQERSRDIEPMKGGHGDNYYYQMIRNIRRFKGMPPDPVPSAPIRVKLDGRFAEWPAVQPEYRSHRGSTLHRDSPGWQGVHYTNTSGRHDLVLTKVARDHKYLFFYLQTAQALDLLAGPGKLRLFVDTDRQKSTGWEGYDFVVQLSGNRSRASLEKSAQTWHWEKIGTVDFAVRGNQLELKIPRDKLGQVKGVNLEFKWSDNMQQEGNIMDFYTNGDVAPAGRFNFHYAAD